MTYSYSLSNIKHKLLTMKNVLIVATTSYAGMGPYVSEIVNSFYTSDNVYYFFRDYEDSFFKKNIKTELQNKSVFYKRTNSKWNKIKDLCSNKYAYHNDILRLCSKWDVALVHFINNPGSKALVRDLKRQGVECVSTVHDLHPHEIKKIWYKTLRWKIMHKKLRENLEHSESLITNSKEQYQELKEQYPQKEIFFHSFPSLITETIKVGKDIPNELKQNKNKYILFFGRIEEYKGLYLLYKVFSENNELNNNYTLVIAGKGEVTFLKGDVVKNVIIINRYIKDEEIKYLYENASCVVYPYISATQSGVLSIAFYFGVPTLVSDVPFFAGIVNDLNDKRMVFKNGDMTDLANKLIAILNNDCSNMIRKEIAYYKKYYDSSAIRNEILTIYHSLLSK